VFKHHRIAACDITLHAVEVGSGPLMVLLPNQSSTRSSRIA
jgi:hypothetical protein